MSPPLAGTEKKKDAKTKVRRKKTMTRAALAANKKNAMLSLGPVTRLGKENSRLSACKHNLRSELPILPGENSEELKRRLELWPSLLGAEGEIEEAVAIRAVHTYWRLERADHSEDSAAERVMLAIDREREEREAEEVCRLEAQLDSHDDPQGVLRKLKRLPGGCRLLIHEFQCLHDRMAKYKILFWSQRTRLFHLLGKREEDFFTDDPVISQWMVGLLGTAFGDDPDKLARVSETLDGLRPAWLGDVEYGQRMQLFVATLPGQDRGQEMVLNLVAATIADLNERLELAKACARHDRALAFQAAQVDDSPAGARRLGYKMRHDGAFHAALRRLDAMKKMRWAGLAADEEDETAAAGNESSPAGTNDGDGFGASDLGAAGDPITAVTNDPIVAEITEPIRVATTNSAPADTSDPISTVTNDAGGVEPAGSDVRVTSDPITAVTNDCLPPVSKHCAPGPVRPFPPLRRGGQSRSAIAVALTVTPPQPPLRKGENVPVLRALRARRHCRPPTPLRKGARLYAAGATVLLPPLRRGGEGGCIRDRRPPEGHGQEPPCIPPS